MTGPPPRRSHRYVRRFGERETPVLPNTDDSPSKDVWLAHGWADRRVPEDQRYDLVFDPLEAANLATDPARAGVRAQLAASVEAWMRATDAPVLDGHVAAPPGRTRTCPTSARGASR